MLELPTAITESRIWCRTLAEQADEKGTTKEARAELRVAFNAMRDRAAKLANEISQDLRQFTVHDITHIDALWGTADVIIGDDYPLTPTEAFVLGGAFLCHDLANGLAAYANGITELKEYPTWSDALHMAMQTRLGRPPEPAELKEPTPEDERMAKEQVLRQQHAKRAESLWSTSWQDRETDTEYHLIENPELRNFFGEMIGRISYSHWWSHEELEQKFTRGLNAPPGYPNDWTVDALKLACLLLVADVAHIDAKRAPGFLRALRKPTGESKNHWIAQEHLAQPRLDRDHIEYTSGKSFGIQDASAWWLCFDMVQAVDHELRRVDTILSDRRPQRFAARWVKGVDDPLKMAQAVRTVGWVLGRTLSDPKRGGVRPNYLFS